MGLQKVVAVSPEIDAPLDRVVAFDVRPVADVIEVGFRADPGEAGGESDDGVAESVHVDAGEPAGKPVQIDPFHSKSVGSIGAVVLILGVVAIAHHAESEVGDEPGAEDVGVVERPARRLLNSLARESAAPR